MGYTNAEKIMRLGVSAELAKLLEEMIADGSLEIGTTSTTAMAGNRQPTSTIRGGVIQQAAVADLAGGADLATTVTKVNAILAALRAAGVLST